MGLPALSLASLLVAAAVVGLNALVLGGPQTSPRGRVFSIGVWLLAGVALSAGVGVRSLAAVAQERSSFLAENQAFAAGEAPASGWRHVFLAITSAERAEGSSCHSRRFLSLVRNDEPLALQPPEMSSRVYYAGRDVGTAERAPALGRCDYVITTAQLDQTDKGRALVAVLARGAKVRQMAGVGHFVVYALAER